MCISTHLPSRLECQQRGLNWNTPFILDKLIGYHHSGDILIKVLSWFCLERDWGSLLPVSQKLGSSLIQQAWERQRSSLRWAPVQLFEMPEVLICLDVRSSAHDLDMGGISCAGSRHSTDVRLLDQDSGASGVCRWKLYVVGPWFFPPWRGRWKKSIGTPLVVQWLRVCLPPQGCGFDPWLGS